MTIETLNCQHANSELRLKRITGGGIQYRRQCMTCGRSASNAIASALVKVCPPEWDERLELEAADRIRQLHVARKAEAERKRRDEYDAYMGSSEWQSKRSAVLMRDRYICQGCLEEPASEVHHITYSHFGAELLFQLISLCGDCHERAHAETSQAEVFEAIGHGA
jgi:hypothetical protein